VANERLTEQESEWATAVRDNCKTLTDWLDRIEAGEDFHPAYLEAMATHSSKMVEAIR
jgi:hypothetical protein